MRTHRCEAVVPKLAGQRRRKALGLKTLCDSASCMHARLARGLSRAVNWASAELPDTAVLPMLCLIPGREVGLCFSAEMGFVAPFCNVAHVCTAHLARFFWTAPSPALKARALCAFVDVLHVACCGLAALKRLCKLSTLGEALLGGPMHTLLGACCRHAGLHQQAAAGPCACSAAAARMAGSAAGQPTSRRPFAVARLDFCMSVILVA